MKLNLITDISDLAFFLNYDHSKLTYLLYRNRPENNYTDFLIPKKNGSFRKISAPNPPLKKLQKSLIKNIFLEGNIGHENSISHGYILGRDIFSNADTHIKKEIIVNVDIENFFDEFHYGRIKGFLMKDNRFGFNEVIASAISNICCYKGKLPQGAPTSPIISNMITEILDKRILRIARKFNLTYTRYVDDLTFSTNDRLFIIQYDKFLDVLNNCIERFGMTLNPRKIRLQYKSSKQEVTGLTVNRKYNTSNDFYKKTRAMANMYYKSGVFLIDGKPGNVNQLEGRFSFINHVLRMEELSNRETVKYKPSDAYHNRFGGRLLEYQKFYFFNNFYNCERPTIVTEGKTDILYLKAALKSLYSKYPTLIEKHDDDTFTFKFKFLKKTDKLQKYIGVNKEGGDTLINISKFYGSQSNCKNLVEYFKKISNVKPSYPIIIIYDNEKAEKKKKYPLNHFENLSKKVKENLDQSSYSLYKDNLYAVKIPTESSKNFEIEDLFEQSLLNEIINGRQFSKNPRSSDDMGKDEFSKYVYNNYKSISFKNFVDLLDLIEKIVIEHNSVD